MPTQAARRFGNHECQQRYARFDSGTQPTTTALCRRQLPFSGVTLTYVDSANF